VISLTSPRQQYVKWGVLKSHMFPINILLGVGFYFCMKSIINFVLVVLDQLATSLVNSGHMEHPLIRSK
jgi:hypothetical protein